MKPTSKKVGPRPSVNMEGVYLERKCHYIGMWKDDTVADNIIRQVADMVRGGKGIKVKLMLSSQGMKATTNSIMSGKNLKDRETLANIYFATVNQYNPQCLLFITKDERRKYRIVAIRCASSTDAGLFVSCFKDLRRAVKSNCVGNNLELRQIESGNWTLRAKHSATDKRQLNTIVEMNGEKMNIHLKQNGVIKNKRTDINSHANISVEPTPSDNNNTVKQNNEKNDVQVDQKDSKTVGIQAELIEENGEPVSNSVSENGFKDELDNLSHEVREIKFMLETSTGIGADVYHDKDKKEVELVNVSKPEEEIVAEVKEPKSPISAVVVGVDSSDNDNDDAEKDSKPIENGLNESKGKESVNSDDSEVRVIVPDYRSSGTQTAPTYVRRYVPKENHTSTTVTYNGNGEPKSPRGTTSFDAWKDDVILRRNVTPRAPRPRSAYLSTSSTGSSLHGSLRDRNPHIIYTTTARTHHTMPHHSLRVPMRRSSNMSSTIERPIEKVYPRPRSVHGSIVYRPITSSQRGTIYAIPTAQTKRVYVDPNHNKMEINGHRKSGSVLQQKQGEKDDTVVIKT